MVIFFFVLNYLVVVELRNWIEESKIRMDLTIHCKLSNNRWSILAEVNSVYSCDLTIVCLKLSRAIDNPLCSQYNTLYIVSALTCSFPIGNNRCYILKYIPTQDKSAKMGIYIIRSVINGSGESECQIYLDYRANTSPGQWSQIIIWIDEAMLYLTVNVSNIKFTLDSR